MSIFLNKRIANGAQESDLTSFKELLPTRSKPLKSYLAKDRISGFNDDKWKQVPCLIMIGNGTSWALMISLDLEVISEYGYRFKKMRIQTELLDLLRDLPVCVGLGVKGDVHKIEQFYTEVSGINLEMAGFIDLSTLALIAGYQNPEKISFFLD